MQLTSHSKSLVAFSNFFLNVLWFYFHNDSISQGLQHGG